MSRRRRLTVLVLTFLAATASAQGDKRPRPLRERDSNRRTEKASAPDAVTINYPDTVNLAAFVDYVSQSLNIKIIYSDELKGQSLVFRPGEVQVPTSHLLDLLRSMLRMHDLAIVDGDVEGWLRIVQTGDMQRHVQEIRPASSADEVKPSNRVVTQVIQVASGDFANVSKHARQFLSSGKASVIEVPDKGLLIVTDYEAAIGKALEVIRLLDVGPKEIELRTIRPKHVAAPVLAEQVTKVLGEKSKLEAKGTPQVVVQADPNSQSLLLIGTQAVTNEVASLVERFDVPVDGSRAPVSYAPRYVSAVRLARLISTVVTPQPAGRDRGEMKLFVDEESNRLYVTASPDVHDQIRRLIEDEDVKSAEPSRPLRVYRPKNRQAKDLIGTLSQVLPNVTMSITEAPEAMETKSEPKSPPGPNRPPVPQEPGQPPPMPPAQEPIPKPAPRKSHVTRLEGKDFSLSHDDHTNAIIAIGPREFHVKLQAMLEELDQRQPQVLIEMTLVAVTFNDSLSLALELANEEKDDGHQYLTFSSFGLSDIDLTTGVRAFNPGGGLNGIIMGPHETPLLYRAIAAHGNSRIIATPKVVVSDNTTATIGSVEESPFTSINASDTVATTTFAGYESAGTTVTVTPHIAQGEHMMLEYSLSFSNFTGGGAVGVPPPRTSNTFTGSVVVPDAHTVVVGGLVTENEADSVTEVPLLGRIPVLGLLFQSSDRARTKSRVFVFIRPTILRDDQFADLKLVSETELDRASISNQDYPESELMWMR
jgi:type II secretory pathway component GspD/PulD (secretin)